MQHASHSCLRVLHQYFIVIVSERGVIEDELVELMEELLEAITPGVPDHDRIGICFLYPLVVLDVPDLVDYKEIKGVAHGEVALDGRVKDTKVHFRASSSEVSKVMMRSRIGFPYLVSPIWK